jgi:hypothetical protein
MLSFAALVLAAALAGCGSALHDATHPVFLSGEDGGAWIDQDAGAMLAARHPGVAVGHARCPYLMNLTGGRSAQCTIPVGRAELRIDVRLDPRFHVDDVDALVVKRETERQLTDDLTRRYGVRFTVRCDGPPLRVMPVRAQFPCGIDAPGGSTGRVDVAVYDRDGSARASLASGDTRQDRMLGRAVTEKTEGGVTLEGPVLARYLHEIVGGAQHGELVRRGLLGAARCPARVTLPPGGNHATCTVRAGDVDVRFDLRFDRGSGLQIEQQQIAIVPALREVAQRYYGHALPSKKAAELVVNCGPHRTVVVEPGASLRCELGTGDGKTTFAVKILDASGHFSFEDED